MAFEVDRIQVFVGTEPETRSLPSGQSVTEFRCSSTRSWKKKDGTWENVDTWVTAVAFGPLAERAAQLKKFGHYSVSGTIENEEWKDREGNKRETLKLRLRSIQFNKESPRGDRPSGSSPAPPPPRPTHVADMNEEQREQLERELDDL